MMTSAEVERALTAVGGSAANSIVTSARDAQTSLVSASSDAANQVKALAADIERSLSAASSATANVVVTGAREAQTTLVSASSDAANQVKSLATDIERSLSAAGSATAASILASAREVQTTLVNASSEAANQVKSLASDVERSLSAAGSATAASILSGAREAQTTLVGASSEAADHVKSLSADVERTLTAVGADTATSILNSAREAQASLTATSADAASQIRSISNDLERALSTVTANTTDRIAATAQTAQQALVTASNEAASKVKSTSADVERSVLAASSTFGSTMTGKTDEIVSYVQQQTDRLSQAIDGKRGALVEAIGSRTTQLTAEVDRVTAEALRAIETRGQGFSQAMLGNSSEVARNITAAGELATSTINKSLKDLELSSRTAIDQSRQVSIAAVTEMQETSKILRTDTVALFERLREGNILLQEVLTGAHDNLNSLERALVTRVADFVSAMNDVTTRNGAATQTLEDQLSVFNTKTAKALEDLHSLSGQFDTHGKALVDAAAVVEQSNRTTTTSLAERKSTLESLVTTIDLRTTDLDQRLSRFTSLLDELLAAAEERARDIARVVAETAGAGSAAISRQFEAVRTAAEEERRHTAEELTQIYQQSTEEADAMFKQSADRFGSMVTSMKQMAVEMQRELEATRTELRRGVLEMPQEAADFHRADAQGDRRPDRGARRAQPHRRPSRPRPRRGLDHPQQRVGLSRGRARACRRRRTYRGTACATAWQQRVEPAAARSRRAGRATHRSPAGGPRRSRSGPGRMAFRSVEPHRWRRRTAARPTRSSAATGRWQSAGVAVARHRPADGPQPRCRDVGPLSARREQGFLQAALHAGRPESVR